VIVKSSKEGQPIKKSQTQGATPKASDLLLGFLRHGIAEKQDPSRYPNDELRPLTEKGEKAVRRMVKRLIQMEFVPRLILTSPLLRARQTAELAQAGFELNPSALKFLPVLRPDTDIHVALRHLAQLRLKGCVLLVGHEPCLGEFLSLLCSGVIGSGFPMRKAGFATVACPSLTPGSGSLQIFVPPAVVDSLT